jgi:hypothetical protein
MAIEIVDIPINSMVIFIVFCMFTRGYALMVSISEASPFWAGLEKG